MPTSASEAKVEISDLGLVECMKRFGFSKHEITKLRTLQPAVQEKFLKALPADFCGSYLLSARKLGTTEGVRHERLKQWLSPLGEDVINTLCFVMKPNSTRLTY